MHTPRFEIHTGSDTWLHADHDGTRVLLDSGAVGLATAEDRDAGSPKPELRVPWQLLQGGVLVASAPEDCDGESVLYLPPEGEPTLLAGSRASAPSPLGRLVSASRASDDTSWHVYRQGGAALVAVVDPRSGRRLARWSIPGALAAVGTTDSAVVAAGAWWRLAPEGHWTALDLPFAPDRVLALGARGSVVFALLRETPDEPALLLRIGPEDHVAFPVPGFETPLHLVVEPAPNKGIWLSEIAAPPPARTLFERFELSKDALVRTDSAVARDFDGRAVWWSSRGHLRASRLGSHGPLMRSRVPLVASGVVELRALDSERMRTPWHRVFIDACVPPNTAIRVSAKAADNVLAAPRAARPPGGVSIGALGPVRPLGSRAPEDVEGWLAQPQPVSGDYLEDRPLAGPQTRASRDELVRGPAQGKPSELQTFELLLDVPPGRFLWLRIELEGTGRVSPLIHAVRATHARPSLLQHLPAWWRRDPRQARDMDKVLALFEGEFTRQQALISALPRLFDPVTSPDDSLQWLSSFLAIVPEDELSTAQRRQLLVDTPELYRRRGTAWAMRRIAEIASGAQVQIIEHFRLRGELAGTAPTLGSTAVLGPDTPTPTKDWANETAHRFSVVIYRPFQARVASLLDRMIEHAKPAHTLHTLCWSDSGMRLDVNARVGVGTQLIAPERTANALGEIVLSSSGHHPLEMP